MCSYRDLVLEDTTESGELVRGVSTEEGRQHIVMVILDGLDAT